MDQLSVSQPFLDRCERYNFLMSMTISPYLKVLLVT